MKIALIIPMNSTDKEKSFYDYQFYSKFLMSNKYVSYLLAIPVLVSLTPAEHEIRVFDENICEIDFSWEADLVGITARTMFSKKAYAIAEAYRKKGVKTVIGGIHASMCPEETAQHCDSVVIGEAEYIWQGLLADAEQGQLKPVYKSEKTADLAAAPMPDRKKLQMDRYLSDIIQTTKGCPFACEFCSVHAFDGQKIRHRAIDQVLREIQSMGNVKSAYKKKNAIFFADDNIIADKKYAKDLFTALKPIGVNWMCQASINIFKEDELLELMQASGCGAVFIGFESLSKDNLKIMKKGINEKYSYTKAIQKIQSYGILVHSSFIVGGDVDTQDSFEELIDFINSNNLLMPLINIMTPFPGTKLFARLEKEGRIVHKDWNKYDTKQAVFTPLNMTGHALEAGYKKIVRSVYDFDAILKKLEHFWDMDFWHHANQVNPIKFKYRLIFALRLFSLIRLSHPKRSRFILKIMPRVLFDKRVRISTILTLMAYNDFAYSI